MHPADSSVAALVADVARTVRADMATLRSMVERSRRMPFRRRQRLALTMPMLGRTPVEWEPLDDRPGLAAEVLAAVRRLEAERYSTASEQAEREAEPAPRLVGQLTAALVVAPGAPPLA